MCNLLPMMLSLSITARCCCMLLSDKLFFAMPKLERTIMLMLLSMAKFACAQEQPDALTFTANAGVSHLHQLPQPCIAAHAVRQELDDAGADSSHACFQQPSMEAVPQPMPPTTLPTKVLLHTSNSSIKACLGFAASWHLFERKWSCPSRQPPSLHQKFLPRPVVYSFVLPCILRHQSLCKLSSVYTRSCLCCAAI